MRMIRDHGQNKKYYHLVEGYNGRLDALQAALLRVKLPHLSEWNAKRRQAAKRYCELLSAAKDIKTPYEPNWSRSNYHLYVILSGQERDELQSYLTTQNIGTGLHYPIPLHLQQGYASLGYCSGDFPVTEKLASQILSLPMYPQMDRDQQDQVAASLLNFYDHQALVIDGLGA
jgi:dTDP-4-amino-4,6-dideoxygalactose transaminase